MILAWLRCFKLNLKHTTKLFALSDHYTLSREWRVIVDQVYIPIIMVGLWCYNQSDVTQLLIMRDSHYGRTCFKSVKTLALAVKKASTFTTAKNVELPGPYTIHTCWVVVPMDTYIYIYTLAVISDIDH